jgi:hypothetical protein
VRTCAAFLTLAAALLCAAGARAAPAEPHIPEAMPPGFRVETSELDGPVFADPKGRTLYRWPYRTMRNGVTGDGKGESNCSDIASNESFWLIGQPEVRVERIAKGEDKGKVRVSVHGFDYYNTRSSRIESGGEDKIALWLLDSDYDGRSLYPRQVFFPMAGEKEGWARLA